MLKYRDFQILTDEQYLEIAREYQTYNKAENIERIKQNLLFVFNSLKPCLSVNTEFILKHKFILELINTSISRFDILYPNKFQNKTEITDNIFQWQNLIVETVELIDKLMINELKKYNLTILKKINCDLITILKTTTQILAKLNIKIYKFM